MSLGRQAELGCGHDPNLLVVSGQGVPRYHNPLNPLVWSLTFYRVVLPPLLRTVLILLLALWGNAQGSSADHPHAAPDDPVGCRNRNHDGAGDLRPRGLCDVAVTGQLGITAATLCSGVSGGIHGRNLKMAAMVRQCHRLCPHSVYRHSNSCPCQDPHSQRAGRDHGSKWHEGGQCHRDSQEPEHECRVAHLFRQVGLLHHLVVAGGIQRCYR